MRLSVRLGVATALVVAVLGAAAPAYAINDPRVPGNECSPDNSSAVGDPVGGNPGITGNKNVRPFVSGNNPGVSTGALGQLNSAAIGHCAQTVP